MKRIVVAIGTLVLLCGCGARRRAAIPGWTATHETMARQIANGWDAGEGDFELRRLRLLVAEDPTDHASRLALAEAYGRAGAPELALEHLRQVRPALPDDAELALEEAKLWDRVGLPERGIREAQEFTRSHPGSADLLLWIGVMHDRRGEWKDGEKAHRAALAAGGRTAAAHNNLGYNLLLQGRVAEALSEFQDSVRLAPANNVAKNNLALAYARRGQTGDQQRAFELWRDSQGAAAAHNNLAAVSIEQGRHGEAREQLSAALSRQRDFTPALRNLHLVAEADGKPASLPARRRRSTWIDWAASLKNILIGTEESGVHSAGAAGNGQPAR